MPEIKIPTLPPIFSKGPGFPVDLGSAFADLWLEDENGEKTTELKRIKIAGIQQLRPKGRIQLVVKGIGSFDALISRINGRSYIKLDGDDPVQCFFLNIDDEKSILLPARDPLNVRHSDQDGAVIQFLLFGFPVASNDPGLDIKEIDKKDRRVTWWTYRQVTLDNDDWIIKFSSHNKTKKWLDIIEETGGLAATHIGLIQRKDSGRISWNETLHIIKGLHYFLSFARGHWQPIGYVRLLNSDGACVCEKWGILRGGVDLAQHDLTWWSPHPKENQLSNVFKGFFRLWNDPLWQEPLSEIIYWYLQANLAGRGHLGSDSALILSQAGLEKLSWFYATQVRKAISEEAFKPGKLRVSDQLRLLASLMNLPHEIPEHLNSLGMSVSGNKFTDAFHAITDIRNQLIHSKSKEKVKPRSVFDAWNLSQWYMEMCLLWLMEYKGKYANRLRSPKWAGDTESVPWAKEVDL